MTISPFSTLIFDFDGTLADSMNQVLPIYNSIAEEVGVPKVSAEDIPKLRRMGPLQALHNYGIPMWKVPRILQAVRTRMRDEIARLEPFDAISEVLSELKRGGARCMLLSSNSQENVEAFLSRHGLNVFERLACGSSLFGKARRLRLVLGQASLVAANAAYVGDEVRDVEAAKSVGIQSIAVSWGYSARESLLGSGPDFLIDHPRQLLDLWRLR